MFRLILCSILTVFLSSNVFASHSSISVDRGTPISVESPISSDYNELMHPENDYILLAGRSPSKKPNKNTKGKLSLTQKFNFKNKKRKLNKVKTQAKKALKQATSDSKVANKAFKKADLQNTASKLKLKDKNKKLNDATAKANDENAGGLRGLLVKARLSLMKRSLEKAKAKHNAGPAAVFNDASIRKSATDFNLNNATANLKLARNDLVVRKQMKNNARGENLLAALKRKDGRKADGGGLPRSKASNASAVPGGIYGPLPAAMVAAAAAARRSSNQQFTPPTRQYDKVPSLPQYDKVPSLPQNNQQPSRNRQPIPSRRLPQTPTQNGQ